MSKEANTKVRYFFWNSISKFYLSTFFREANVNVLTNCYSFSEWFITLSHLLLAGPTLSTLSFDLFYSTDLGLFGPLLKSVKGFSTLKA